MDALVREARSLRRRAEKLAETASGSGSTAVDRRAREAVDAVARLEAEVVRLQQHERRRAQGTRRLAP